MRRLLALDTSTRWGGIALLVAPGAARPPEVVIEIGMQVAESHGERLLERIEWLLAAAGWPRTSIDAYAAACGPGSFTGVRVGLGTIRGLALAADRPCYGVGTLEALAEAHGPASEERAALIDAGRGEHYAARYDAASSPPRETAPPRVGPVAEIAAPRDARPLLWIPAPGTSFAGPPPAGVRVAAPPRGLAAALGAIVAQRHPHLTGPAPPLAPLYVRPPDVRMRSQRG